MIVMSIIVIGCSDSKTGPKDPPISIVSIGDTIQFGSYNWRVLDIENDRALIITENILELRRYQDSNVSITWENCSLRTYLNGSFYDTFNQTDRARIHEVTNENLNNQSWGTNGGRNTQDKIFLLSLAEVVRYFGDSGQLGSIDREPRISDQYNSNRIATFNGTASWWWLRSPGFYTSQAAGVTISGPISMNGLNVNYDRGGVRPALWLNLQASR